MNSLILLHSINEVVLENSTKILRGNQVTYLFWSRGYPNNYISQAIAYISERLLIYQGVSWLCSFSRNKKKVLITPTMGIYTVRNENIGQIKLDTCCFCPHTFSLHSMYCFQLLKKEFILLIESRDTQRYTKWPSLSEICELNCSFLEQNSIFEKNFDFWAKIRWAKISIFKQKFDFWEKIQILRKISIFEPKFISWAKFDFWEKMDHPTYRSPPPPLSASVTPPFLL
jgi:hypothetical protein